MGGALRDRRSRVWVRKRILTLLPHFSRFDSHGGVLDGQAVANRGNCPALCRGCLWGRIAKGRIQPYQPYISELNAMDSVWSWQIGYLGFLPFGLLALISFSVIAQNERLSGVSQIGFWMLIVKTIAYAGSAFALCGRVSGAFECKIWGRSGMIVGGNLSIQGIPGGLSDYDEICAV